ncbi:MAG TPA: flavodoxin reductase [Bacteroidia bacterium]|jgi:ferredoxin-NADP reductase|nr:flavodoxin reductase [Bacteroidia bacterium]
MQQHHVKIKSIGHVTHDVLKIVTEKPENYTFTPGQATEIAMNKTGWKDEKRPFTFTCLPENDYLEFTIKTYPSRNGVTNQLLQLEKNDVLILHEVFGAINYKGEGVFIAGGAGVTPFISIFRSLQATDKIGNNKLIFANKTRGDIIHEAEFKKMLGSNFINILSDEAVDGYATGFITADFIKKHSDGVNKMFYICGPPPMMDAIEGQLKNLHINKNSIIKEEF